jgi:hypothetical protein
MNFATRHWLRLSLRGLLVVVALFGLGAGWIGSQLDWIRQRRAFLNSPPTRYLHVVGQRDAPWSLGLFGERGYAYISISFCPWTEWKTHQHSADETKQLNRVKGLFPEALVSTAPLDGRSPYWKNGVLP